MKNFKFLLILISLLGLSCKKQASTYKNSVFEIVLLNQNGENLLDNPALFNEQNINMYHVLNGQTNLYSKPTADAPKGIKIIKESTFPTRLSVFANNNRNEAFPITIIKFGNLKEDIIKCQFEHDKKGGFINLIKIWHNHEIKYDAVSGIGSQTFTIIK